MPSTLYVQGRMQSCSAVDSSLLMKITKALLFLICVFYVTFAQSQPVEMQTVGRFQIDRTEVSIGQFKRFVEATQIRTAAELAGGGSTFESGWERRAGWNWRAPFGRPGSDQDPAVHVTYNEAESFCKWAGKRLPTDAEWGEAAYTERRLKPPAGFVMGRTYLYPTGDSPHGANCLGDCGSTGRLAYSDTSRGRGHALVGTTTAGVNGLFDMGANVWEWVNSGQSTDKRTRGGSWWYGSVSMRDSHHQSKPADTAVVYIGFRCAKDASP
jgi:formylglycine-generating enzyme